MISVVCLHPQEYATNEELELMLLKQMQKPKSKSVTIPEADHNVQESVGPNTLADDLTRE